MGYTGGIALYWDISVTILRAHHLNATVITFDRHPKEVVQTEWKPLLLTTFEERMRLLEGTGIDRCVVLPFTKEMARLSAHDFMVLMAEAGCEGADDWV